MAKVPLGKRIKPMLTTSAVEGVGDEQGVVDGAELDPVAAQHQTVVLEVLPDFEDRRILQERFQEVERRSEWHLFEDAVAEIETAAGAMSERHVARPARCHRERKADEF